MEWDYLLNFGKLQKLSNFRLRVVDCNGKKLAPIRKVKQRNMMKWLRHICYMSRYHLCVGKFENINWFHNRLYCSSLNTLCFFSPSHVRYGAYSLVHQKHKGWYSWILNTLVGFIYMFGFVMMTPQVRQRYLAFDILI